MGTGIGGGVVLDGKMFRGSGFAAGEIGQMSIHFDGKPGHYGNLGALEKYTGNQQIAEHAVQRYAEAGSIKDIADCTPKMIADAAQAGDDIARQIWGEIADWLGTAISSIAWLLNPDAFVIGGGVAQAGDLIFIR
jgi:glucokinase